MSPPLAPPQSLQGNRSDTAFGLRVAVCSDLGKVRTHQEDAVGAFASDDPTLAGRKGHLLVVVDGMGGHNAGDVASHLALNEIERSYYADPADDLGVALANAFNAASRTIYQQAQIDATRTGMGATAAAVAIRGQDVRIASAGDSRVYLMRAGAITQITEDHSWVADQMRRGVLTPEQARVHPQRNVVTRALGRQPTVEVDLFKGVLRPGDMLLLCTDGLVNHVTDAELIEIASAHPPDQAANRLIDMANDRGGSDNISLIIASVEAGDALRASGLPASAIRSGGPRHWLPAVIGILILLFVVVIGTVAWGLLRRPIASPPLPTPPVATLAATLAPALSQATPTVADIAPTAFPPTSTPAVTQTPTPTGIPGATMAFVSAPVLERPEQRALAVSGPIVFSWQWNGKLTDGQAFEVRIWREGNTEHQAAAQASREKIGGLWTQTIDLRHAPATKNGGSGDYLWTVAVIELSGRRIGQEAKPRTLTYKGEPTVEVTKPQASPGAKATRLPRPTARPTRPPRPTMVVPTLPAATLIPTVFPPRPPRSPRP